MNRQNWQQAVNRELIKHCWLFPPDALTSLDQEALLVSQEQLRSSLNWTQARLQQVTVEKDELREDYRWCMQELFGKSFSGKPTLTISLTSDLCSTSTSLDRCRGRTRIPFK